MQNTKTTFIFASLIFEQEKYGMHLICKNIPCRYRLGALPSVLTHRWRPSAGGDSLQQRPPSRLLSQTGRPCWRGQADSPAPQEIVLNHRSGQKCCQGPVPYPFRHKHVSIPFHHKVVSFPFYCGAQGDDNNARITAATPEHNPGGRNRTTHARHPGTEAGSMG